MKGGHILAKNLFSSSILKLVYNIDKSCVASKEGKEVDREALNDDPDEVQHPRHHGHLPLVHTAQHQGWKNVFYQGMD